MRSPSYKKEYESLGPDFGTMRNFETTAGAFAQLVKEKVKRETVTIGNPGDGVLYTYDADHPQSRQAAGIKVPAKEGR